MNTLSNNAGIKIRDFSKQTGISVSKLYQLKSSGKLIPIRKDGYYLIYDESQVVDAEKYVRKMKLLVGGKNVVKDMDDLDDFFAYLLGMIMADGTVLESGQVQLELKDKQVIDDIAAVLGADVHLRSDRLMWRITVPRPVANRLVEYGVCRRKCEGFDVPEMSERSFGCFLRGLFDGDGSISEKGNGLVVRFHGHPKAMAYIQSTLMEHFGLYLPWVADNRIESGMLETSKKSSVDLLYNIMYKVDGVSLLRKKMIFNKNTKQS